MNEEHHDRVQEKIRKKVLEESRKAEQEIDEEANVEALSEMTGMNQEEVKKLARETRIEENLNQAFKKVFYIGAALLAVVTLVVVSLIVLIF